MTAKTRRTMSRSTVTTVLDLLGMALVSAGAWLVYAPAGFVVGGALLLVTSWRISS